MSRFQQSPQRDWRFLEPAGKDGKRRAGWLSLNSPLPLELLVTPLPAEADLSQSWQKPLVLLDNQPPQLNLLTDLFQLTPAEQRLAELLAQQLNPETCAERLGVSINTVRSQLRALLRKTGTGRQAELVSLIGRLHR
ncbi:hypothetical protein PS647_03771 [Pseudomonas fluorescens]|uniref:helix-turn-helix transcriptional regulator n=1 Tax=Pseudomonas fluorescens TaxID=294 RepID=UPI001240F3A8|nr:helix-turn-helix transcriptional regulator [Pseudomonas fluorescens]VVN09572.1 hypothetical protein PS647_03771 [Pseudomonas fluorescens]